MTGDTFAGSCFTKDIQSIHLNALNYKPDTPCKFPFT